jgi:acyl-CoA dehydrogenase
MFWLLLFVVAVLALAYAGARIATSTAVLGTAILFYGLFGHSFLLFLALLLSWAALLLPLNVEALRQEWFTRPMLKRFRQRMPVLDVRTRAALETDTAGWEAELFGPRPDWERMRALASGSLSDEERAFLDGPVETFCRLCDDWKITHEDNDLSEEAWTFLRRYRLLAMQLPRQFGGLEFSATACSAVIAKIASSPGGMTAAMTVAYANAPGVAELLQRHGSDAQKLLYLPRLAVGDEIACFAPAGFGADVEGDDARDRATGTVMEGEWQGLRLTGVQLDIELGSVVLAPAASLLGVAIRLRDPERRLGGAEQPGMSCVLLPRDTPGLDIGRRQLALDNPLPIGPVRARGLFVPLEHLIGGAAQLGQIERMLGECSVAGRGLPLAAASAGNAVFAALASGAYARLRRAAGHPLSHSEVVREALARCIARAYAADALRRSGAAALDRGEHSATAAAIVKTQATALAREVVEDATDLHGGNAILLGPANYLGRRWQAAPIAVALDGTNLHAPSRVVFMRGILRCHPYLLGELLAARDDNPANALEDFDALLWAHLGHIGMAAARAFVLGISGSLVADVPSGAARRHRQRVSRYSAVFALVSEAGVLLGERLRQHENLCARLGEVLMLLYRVCAAMRKWEDDGRPADDWAIVDWICLDAFARIETALAAALRQLPSQSMRWALRVLVFPYVRRMRPPGNPLTNLVAARAYSPGGSRQRLGAICFAPKTAGGPLSRLNAALDGWLAAEGLARRCEAAQREHRLPPGALASIIDAAAGAGVLNVEEAQQLRAACAAVDSICALDDFDAAGLRRRAG